MSICVKRIEKWMQKIITQKNMAVFLTAVYFASIVPMLLIAHYNYPSADDYTNGAAGYAQWSKTHSAGRVLGEAWARMISEYKEWRGCYSSSFFSSLPPGIFGEKLGFVTPWLMIFILSAAVFYFVYGITVKVCKASKSVCISASMLILLMLLHCMPAKARVEMFYWFSGAINYTFMFALELFFFGMLISVVVSRGTRRVCSMVMASVLAVLVAGANQMTSLNAMIVVLAAALVITCCKKWKEYKWVSIPMGCYTVSFIVAIAAPGNYVRMYYADHMNPVRAVILSFYYTTDLAMDEWTTWPVLIITAALVPLFWEMVKKLKFSFGCPLVVVAGGYCIVSAMFTPSLYAVGNIGAGRIQGLVYLEYIFVGTLAIAYLTGWVQKKFEKKCSGQEDAVEREDHFSPESCWHLAGCLIFLIFGTVLTVIPEPRYYSCTSAVTDLCSGAAKEFGREMEERVRLYQNGQGEIVVVSELKNHPELLFFSDIKPDMEDWENKGVAKYYNLAGVVVKKQD